MFIYDKMSPVLLKIIYVSDNRCTENEKTNSIFSIYFPKIVPVMR